MTEHYTDIDRLILDRWKDVVGLTRAHRELQGRIQETVDTVGDRVARWAQPHGFMIETRARYAEIHAWRPAWAQKRRGEKVSLTLGGFCPDGFRKTNTPHPYLWVYTSGLEDFRVKEPERITFGHALRASLGDEAQEWEARDIDEANGPLGRYLTDYDDEARVRLIGDSDALYDFCTKHFPALFSLADTIERELTRLAK